MLRLALVSAITLACVTLTHGFDTTQNFDITPLENATSGESRIIEAPLAVEGESRIELAFDNGQWASVDPATREWFRSLKSPGGGFCCDGADGVRIEDPAWKENQDHSYEVFARERWNQIPPDRVLTGSNKVGYAILWWPPSQEKPTCFLPGSKF